MHHTKKRDANANSAPFLKWPGGKRRVVPHLLPHLGLPVQRLIEPFCGGCALSLAVAEKAEGFWLNDINEDLIMLLSQIRANTEEFLKKARSYFNPRFNEEEAYYRLRDKFNAATDKLERSALFLYLNRHGYNGLCRYNSSGEYNVPFGRYAAPYFPEAEIRSAAGMMARAEITDLDFERVLESCGPGDAVYCDPPYVPLSATASFTSYAAGGFGPEEQERLAAAAERAAGRGALVVVSNHDTPLTRKLYRNAKRFYIDVRRNISCDGENRGLAREVIAVYRSVKV